jgi:dihydrofolate reductase
LIDESFNFAADMKISLIAAMDINNAIGYHNDLMWHLPDDFKWFKRHTLGKPLIMGRNTMNSLGKPLPKRLNITLSSSDKDIIEGFQHAFGIEEAFTMIPEDTEEVMVIGGGNIFRQVMDMADRLYVTRIHHGFENADTYFPKWEESEWKQVFHEFHPEDEKHQFAFDFFILERAGLVKNDN